MNSCYHQYKKIEDSNSRLGLVDERIFRCDVIIANLLTRLTLVMKLDGISATPIESITRL